MKARHNKWIRAGICGLVLGVCLSACSPRANAFSYEQSAAQSASLADTQVMLSAGYDLDPRDGGRPVGLIAAALGVPSEVFREAFSHVNPAGAGQAPSAERVHSNKAALLEALGPYGVTNEELDRVSDYYRYNRSAGEMWPTRPAEVEAVLDAKGAIREFRIVDGGSGYSSAPSITLAGYPSLQVEVVMSYGKDLATNGSIAEIKLISR